MVSYASRETDPTDAEQSRSNSRSGEGLDPYEGRPAYAWGTTVSVERMMDQSSYCLGQDQLAGR